MSTQTLKNFLIPGTSPSVPETAFIAPGAVVIGAVELGVESSIWFGSVLRGDINRIIVGSQSNVQDGSVLHVSDDHACVLGDRVTVGHRAIVHACTVEDDVLIGMGAIILDGARIGARSTIAAGALVTKNMQVPPGSLVIGAPAKVVRALTPEEQAANTKLAHKYVEVSRRYLAEDVPSLITPSSVAAGETARDS
ncbi:gamma carbonic anhydrase family protein [Brevifollis gellanilyticus]|uniref:Gamma carbonic anhydrase family protein n=1 Tax=Brevifollis gellanilyticus TaxID=748831 RepID=A0A512MG07_9BACT|nr:gamma carbonic anhydrase family protein [Brevifollis gellanilyticus]GEP45674.1 gamma carbonic anhydrase family protein [Brevifollis gellanilyticus]